VGLVPLILILAAAAAHAAWNLLAKQASGGVAFVWLCGAAGVLIYAPAALIQLVIDSDRLSWAGLGFMAGSAILHAGYFNALQRGYKLGDLSLVYPLARGTGPLLSVIAAIVILGETANGLTLLGAGLIIVAIISLAGGARGDHARPAIVLAALTGACTAAYTVWDAHAVTALHQPVIVYYWGAELIRAGLLAGPAWRRRAELSADGPRRVESSVDGPRRVESSGERHRPGGLSVDRRQLRAAVGVGLLSPAAYILILIAFTLAPVVVVAPAREVSIVIGVLIGANSLGEGHALKRTIAATAILAGIVLLAVS
jgi:drug/metabolite transporter (DMT)-like permease